MAVIDVRTGRLASRRSGAAAAVRALAVGLVSGGLALAASAVPPWPVLQQGYEDIEPLARSLLNQQVDFRAPTGFERVYDMGDGRLARMDGGLTAVFPRSTYSLGTNGPVPTIPPGTVFYIGTPPPLARGPNDVFGTGGSRRVFSPNFAGERAGRGGAGRPSLSSPGVGPLDVPRPAPRAGTSPIPTHVLVTPPPTMFNSEPERHRIVGGLIERARRAGRGE